METAFTSPPLIFQEQLLAFDKEPFQVMEENEIYNLIHKKLPEGKTNFDPAEMAEMIAFRFLETPRQQKAAQGYYFRPFLITTNEDGSTNEFPSVSSVTADTISYWEYRMANAVHPVLCARYAGLVYELSFLVTGKKAHHTIARKYIEALISVIEQKLYAVPVYAIIKIKRALEVANTLNDQDLIERCKKATLFLEDQIAVNNQPGLWGFGFDFLMSGKKKNMSQPEEDKIIATLESRLEDMILIDSWCAECAAQRLASYYHAQNQTTNVKRVLASLELSYEHAAAHVATIQKAHFVEKLYQFYKRFQLNDDAERLLLKLRALSKETDQDLKLISNEIKISRDDIDKYVNQILAGDNETIFLRIIMANVPTIKDAQADIAELSKLSPIRYFISTQLLDKKGRRVATIPPLSEDPDSHLVQQLSMTIRINVIWLNFTFEEAIKREILSVHSIVRFLNASCIIEKQRFMMIEKGLQAYFEKDYMQSIHLLIPQVEEAIRNLVEMNGGNVMIQKGDSFNLKTFDHLLSDEIITEVLGADMALYFKVLFTDRRGWNLRNNIAHGLVDPEHFNKQNADRVLHALLCLGLVRLKEDSNKD